eukprot:scaffold33388_cov122-Isochrysis_galbana.AAC.7
MGERGLNGGATEAAPLPPVTAALTRLSGVTSHLPSCGTHSCLANTWPKTTCLDGTDPVRESHAE